MSFPPLFPTKFSVAKAKRFEQRANELAEIEERKVENDVSHFFGYDCDEGNEIPSIEETHKEIMKKLVSIFLLNDDDSFDTNSDFSSVEPFEDNNLQDDSGYTIVNDHIHDLLLDTPISNSTSESNANENSVSGTDTPNVDIIDDFANYVDKNEFLTEPSFQSWNNQLLSNRESDASELYCNEPAFLMQYHVKQPALPISYHVKKQVLPVMHSSWEYENNEWGRYWSKEWMLFNERNGYGKSPILQPVTKSGTKRKEPSISKKNTKGKKPKN